MQKFSILRFSEVGVSNVCNKRYFTIERNKLCEEEGGEREDWKESEALDEDRDSVVNNMHEITQLRYQRCRFARRHYATRSLVLYVFHYS